MGTMTGLLDAVTFAKLSTKYSIILKFAHIVLHCVKLVQAHEVRECLKKNVWNRFSYL